MGSSTQGFNPQRTPVLFIALPIAKRQNYAPGTSSRGGARGRGGRGGKPNSYPSPPLIPSLELSAFPPLTSSQQQTSSPICPPQNVELTIASIEPTTVSLQQTSVAKPRPSWSNILVSNNFWSENAALSFVPSSIINGKWVAVCPKHSVQLEIERWKNALVGFVLGSSPSHQNMLKFVQKNWRAATLPRVYTLGNEIFLFDFEKASDKEYILESGPWSYDSKPIILIPWSPSLDIEKLGVTTVPIWIRLPGL